MKQYNKVAVHMLQMGIQNMICASVQGLTSTDAGIGNGGSSTGAGSGFSGINARGTNGANVVFNFD